MWRLSIHSTLDIKISEYQYSCLRSRVGSETDWELLVHDVPQGRHPLLVLKYGNSTRFISGDSRLTGRVSRLQEELRSCPSNVSRNENLHLQVALPIQYLTIFPLMSSMWHSLPTQYALPLPLVIAGPHRHCYHLSYYHLSHYHLLHYYHLSYYYRLLYHYHFSHYHWR
ncbi:hypothetical protein DAEQUDRAFT_729812 [Daedalea quercina L-15889]|uniref:Uncharacterized protein n=1 Tax=Daedalea quercina L-15889 TaxID=1314783 RepID=A0A165NDN1_9APHY|nr:hypothetical protein DAEQUDRAFT_729812 [Daedalea quercina L-15889]